MTHKLRQPNLLLCYALCYALVTSCGYALVTSQLVFLFCVFSSGRKAAAVCANFGIHRVRWCMDPIKFLIV